MISNFTYYGGLKIKIYIFFSECIWAGFGQPSDRVTLSPLKSRQSWSRSSRTPSDPKPDTDTKHCNKRCNSVSLSVDAAVSQRCHSWAATVLSE